ncbi:MAG: hypothetical protein RBG13Loki_1449 [Promethearchaeota archaeon CR_4]|nr:MAG: hypothetical protein RBG13Loki_1449 [Candidatus Lokiarchaeota archaeon CR_4]
MNFSLKVKKVQKTQYQRIFQTPLRKKELDAIKKIDFIDSNLKIGEQLRKTLSLQLENILNLTILFMNPVNNQEFLHFVEVITKSGVIETNKPFVVNQKLNICKCSAQSSKIANISDYSFIRRIDLTTKASRQANVTTENILFDPTQLTFENLIGDSSYSEICVIDSGITGEIAKYVSINESNGFMNPNDEIDHGTRVSSLAVFGSDLIHRQRTLIPKVRLINVKIEGPNGIYDAFEALLESIEKFSERCKIFNLSYAYFDIDPVIRQNNLNKLDQLIHEKNVVVIICAGNIDTNDIRAELSNYPSYLLEFPVLFPSDSQNALCIGGMCCTSRRGNCIYGRYTRFKLPPTMINIPEDLIIKFKPEIITYGGDNSFNSDPIINEINKEIPVINPSNQMVTDMGTSFATPLISNIFSVILSIFQNQFQNSETYKAIFINCCDFMELGTGSNVCPHFILSDLNGFLKNKIIMGFEGDLIPNETIENNRKNEIVRGKILSFFLPLKAESFDLIAIHSSNLDKFNYLNEKTRLVVKISKNNGTGADYRKSYGNIGKFAPVCYGHYEFRRNYEGLTRISVWTQTKGIEANRIKSMTIRFGISLRINIKRAFRKNIKEIYAEITRNTTSSNLTRELQEPNVEEIISTPN